MRNLLSLFIFVFVFQLHAQPLHLGVKIGTNATFIIDRSNLSFGERFDRGNGFQLGLEAEYLLFKTIGIKVETNFQNNEFDYIQEKIVNILPDGTNGQSASVLERIKVKNGSFRLGASVVLDFGSFGISAGSDLGLLTGSKGKVIRSYLTNNMNTEIEEELEYDFLTDEPGKEGAYWSDSEDLGSLFKRFNSSANLAFQFNLFRSLEIEIKSNYGLNDLLNDFYPQVEEEDSGRQIDLLLSARYKFPLRLKKKATEEEATEEF